MRFRALVWFAAVCASLASSACAHRARSVSAAVTRGSQVYARECQACHGADGSGTQIGPSLRNERSRRSYSAVRAIISDPQPPMPKLYPGRLTQNEVREVSAYVESL